MAELNRTERLQPSLLDRLTDLEPGRTRENLDQQSLTMAQLRRAVLRDLGWLLNTTNLEATEALPEGSLTARSTLNYGVPGIAGTDASDNPGNSFARTIAAAIRAYEPRIRPETVQVQARPIDADAPLPTMVLEITGELWAQPVPQQIFLETAIELETRTAVVTEAKARA